MATNTVHISDNFSKAIQNKKLVIFAGAGLSAAPPTKLPGWYKINRQIVEALCNRIESYCNRKDYLQQVQSAIDDRRNNNGFPPDYQAQIIEEYAGPDYFKALQSLDVNSRNAGHDAIAFLAKQGLLAAIITTNFDRLIEQSLEAQKVEYEVAIDETSYEHSYQKLVSNENSPILILKVHGCVSNANSLIDTLKQRLLGRNQYLNKSLDLLIARHPWLYAGFSAADLETDEDYLRILPSANTSPGIAYIQWPGAKALQAGAVKLIECYSGKSEVIIAELPDAFAAIAKIAGSKHPESDYSTPSDTDELVTTHLQQWATALHPAAAVNCLAAICESNGMSYQAFKLLHRFWKDVLNTDREGKDFERYRQMHGRLGMGFGLLSYLNDMNSTKGEESFQNLLRRGTDGDPLATIWAGIALLWAGNRAEAENMLFYHIDKLEKNEFSGEITIDCWNAISEAFYLFCEPENIFKTWISCYNYAEEAGDLPRQAKCVALTALHYACYYPDEYPEFMNIHSSFLNKAARLNDPGIEGFLSLAAGRYLTRTIQNPPEAIENLLNANKLLINAGRYPWALLAKIELAVALADNGQFEEAAIIINEANQQVDNWQILCIRHAEVVGQLRLMTGMKQEARLAFEDAISYARKINIPRQAEAIEKYLEYC